MTSESQALLLSEFDENGSCTIELRGWSFIGPRQWAMVQLEKLTRLDCKMDRI